MSNLTITQAGKVLALEFDTYPDGTENLRTIRSLGRESCFINVTIREPNRDLFRIALVKQALDEAGIEDVILHCDYMPHARADRQFDRFETVPLKAFSALINSMEFKEVLVLDPHNYVAMQEYVANLTAYLPDWKLPKHFIVCAPDQGAEARAKVVAEKGNNLFMQCIKQRDPDTSELKITHIMCKEEPKGQTVCIVDDICDGGGTFITLAKQLKELGYGKVILCVSHGIFSKGLKVFEEIIDEIQCKNIVCNYVNETDIQRFNRGDY